jgi:flavin reductase (DIM6/NTAB) family NADH-FMN oxidoreductase RutF
VPNAEGVIGPVPPGWDPGEYDRLRRRVLWSLPTGLYVLGSRAADRQNLMTVSLVMQASVDPKCVVASVEAAALTHRLVHDGGVFALSILKREDRAIVRKFVKPLADLAGFDTFTAVTGAPVLAQAGAWLDCEVRHELALGSHSLFVGEVVACGGEPDSLEVLRMEDTRMSYGG